MKAVLVSLIVFSMFVFAPGIQAETNSASNIQSTGLKSLGVNPRLANLVAPLPDLSASSLNEIRGAKTSEEIKPNSAITQYGVNLLNLTDKKSRIPNLVIRGGMPTLSSKVAAALQVQLSW